jgi:hypothetical protein
MHVFGNNAGWQQEIFHILCPPGLYLRTAFSAKRNSSEEKGMWEIKPDRVNSK